MAASRKREYSTLVARRDQEVHRSSHGHQDAEAGVAISDDTIFRIYSMPKPIVSTALMLFHEEGRFQLDQLVATYLPAFATLKVLGADGSLADDDRRHAQPHERSHLRLHV